MVKNTEIVANLRDNNGFQQCEKEKDSYYKTVQKRQKNTEIRISNHFTWLWTWVKHGYALNASINVCITFINGETAPSMEHTKVNLSLKDENGNISGSITPFEVIQYVYNCNNLTPRDIRSINVAMRKTFIGGRYIDPFLTNPQKYAKSYKLVPNSAPILIPNNRIHTEMQPQEVEINKNQINCNNIMKTRTNRIRLTESQLHRVIKESVKKVLKELSNSYINNALDKAHNDYLDAEGGQNKYEYKSSDARQFAKQKRLRQMKTFNDEINQRTNNRGAGF